MILVTGGAGFIGANFVLQWLAETQEPIVNFDALTYAGNLESLASVADDPRYHFVHGDLRRPADIHEALQRFKPRAVLHFAAESHVDRSIHGPDEFLQTNVVGTFNLLTEVRAYWLALPEGEREAFRYLHVSTDEVYGSLSAEAPAFTEQHPYQPNSPYSASKAASDHFVRAWHHTYGLPTLTTNCSNNYGPLQFPEKLIPLMIEKALAGEPLPVYGDGQNIRDWLYVGDHCSAIRRVLEAGRPGETYNIGGNAERTNLQVLEALCTVLDARRPRAQGSHFDAITFVQDRPGHDRRYAIDARKIRDELGWSPAWCFDDGLAATVDWYLQQRTWVEHVKSGSYREWLGQQYGEGSA